MEFGFYLFVFKKGFLFLSFLTPTVATWKPMADVLHGAAVHCHQVPQELQLRKKGHHPTNGLENPHPTPCEQNSTQLHTLPI